MNTTQLSHALARFLAVDDPADPPAAATLDILRAINEGVQRFYALAPAYWRRTTFSLTLRAPQSASITFSAQFSNTLVGDPFTEAQTGCTLRVEGQPDNEIIGTGTVLDDYLGSTLGVSATIYGDCAAVPTAIERLVTAPRLQGVSLAPRTEELTRAQARDVREMTAHYAPACPTHYAFDGGAIPGGGSTMSYLRVGPAPDADYSVRFDAEFSASAITFSNLSTPSEIPAPEAAAQAALVPLCAAALITSSYWANPRAATAAMAAAEAAVAWLMSRPQDPGLTAHRIGTPTNF
jgi:hypothetical protein